MPQVDTAEFPAEGRDVLSPGAGRAGSESCDPGSLQQPGTA